MASVLEQAENCKSADELKKKGAVNGLKRWLDNFNDTSSTLHKTVNNIKNGVEIAQDITERYNYNWSIVLAQTITLLQEKLIFQRVNSRFL